MVSNKLHTQVISGCLFLQMGHGGWLIRGLNEVVWGGVIFTNEEFEHDINSRLRPIWRDIGVIFNTHKCGGKFLSLIARKRYTWHKFYIWHFFSQIQLAFKWYKKFDVLSISKLASEQINWVCPTYFFFFLKNQGEWKTIYRIVAKSLKTMFKMLHFVYPVYSSKMRRS